MYVCVSASVYVHMGANVYMCANVYVSVRCACVHWCGCCVCLRECQCVCVHVGAYVVMQSIWIFQLRELMRALNKKIVSQLGQAYCSHHI